MIIVNGVLLASIDRLDGAENVPVRTSMEGTTRATTDQTTNHDAEIKKNCPRVKSPTEFYWPRPSDIARRAARRTMQKLVADENTYFQTWDPTDPGKTFEYIYNSYQSLF